MASPSRKPKGPWAWAQLAVAIGTIAWAVALWVYPVVEGAPESPRNVAVPGVNLAAGLFFFVAFILFARDHPDGRIVGFFGLAMFLAANIWYAYDLYQVPGQCFDALGNSDDCFVYRGTSPDADWMGGKVGVVIGVTFMGGMLEIALLLTMTIWFSRDRRRRAEEQRALEEEAWAGDRRMA